MVCAEAAASELPRWGRGDDGLQTEAAAGTARRQEASDRGSEKESRRRAALTMTDLSYSQGGQCGERVSEIEWDETANARNERNEHAGATTLTTLLHASSWMQDSCDVGEGGRFSGTDSPAHELSLLSASPIPSTPASGISHSQRRRVAAVIETPRQQASAARVGELDVLCDESSEDTSATHASGQGGGDGLSLFRR